MLTSLPSRDRSLAEFAPGESVSFERTITSHDIDEFARLSGDFNPLHLDDEYARARGYRGRVAQGHLVAAPLSAMAGQLLPGQRSLLFAVQFELVAPVYASDVLTYSGIVTHVSAAIAALVVDVVVRRDSDIVLRGSYRCKVLGDVPA